MRIDKTELWHEVLLLVLAFVLGVVALAYMLSSCTQEPLLSYDGEGKEYMDFSLELTSPGAFTPADTRAMDADQQNAVNRATVLVFKDNKLLYYMIGTVSTMDGSGGTKKQVKVNLKTSQSESDLYDIMVIGNPPGSFNFASYVNQSKSTLKSAFNISLSSKWSGSEFIMYGEALQTLIKPTTNNFKIQMLRSLARVDIGVGTYNAAQDTWGGLTSVFKLTEVRVVNSRNKYAVIPSTTTFNESGNVKVSEPTIPASTGLQGTTAANAIKYSGWPDITSSAYTKSTIFIAEAPNSGSRVTLLVGGLYNNGATTTYYRIDMCVPKTGAAGGYEHLNILRNHLYRITITGVSGAGFTNPQEALLSVPINMTTELTPVAEGGTGDIIFDGNNYIHTDVSNVQIYGAPDGRKIYNIGTVKANFVNGVAATVTGLGSTINLASGVATPIKVAIPASTIPGRYTINCTVKVGRLTKVIPVTIQPPVDAHFDFLPFQNVSNISIDSPQPWLTLSQTTTYVKSEQQFSYIAGSSAGKACFHFDENIATTGNPRMARALVQRNNYSGTTCVIFEQCNLSGMVVGYFGGVRNNEGYTTRLAVESVEEHNYRFYDDTSIAATPGGMQWGFYNKATDATNKDAGKAMTLLLVKRNDSGISAPYTIYNNYAARYCYDKNRDTNGDGQINDNEIVWYLPAQNQLMGVWIAHSGITAPLGGEKGYWTATNAPVVPPTEEAPNPPYYPPTHSWYVQFLSHQGFTDFVNGPKRNDHPVRCVRELNP